VVQTGSDAHPAFYSMGTGCDVAECKNEWIVPALLPSFMVWAGTLAGTMFSVICRAPVFGVEVKIKWSYTSTPHNAPS